VRRFATVAVVVFQSSRHEKAEGPANRRRACTNQHHAEDAADVTGFGQGSKPNAVAHVGGVIERLRVPTWLEEGTIQKRKKVNQREVAA